MREPVFAHGHLFVGLNDIVPSNGDRLATVGIAWFLVKPSVTDDDHGSPVKVTGSVKKVGVIAAENR